MVEIKVILYGRTSFFHCCTHIEAFLKDIPTGRSFSVSFDGTQTSRFDFEEFKTIQPGCCIDIVTLYSNENYDQYIEQYKEKFKFADYHYLGKNCAHAVDDLLEYFFPKKTKTPENVFYYAYQMLCCLCFMGTIGLKCFSVPQCIIPTPDNTFKKARQLSHQPDRLENMLIAIGEAKTPLRRSSTV